MNLLKERFSWNNPQHIEETLGPEILSQHTELLSAKLRNERNERVTLRFLNWFFKRHAVVGPEEEALLFSVFTEASDESMEKLANYLVATCGHSGALNRTELINEEAKKAIALAKEGGLKPRAYHHVNTAFTLIQAAKHIMTTEINKLGDKKA